MKHFSLQQQSVLIFIALLILGILYFKFYYYPPLPPEETVKEIVIEVSGEIRNPGVHIFKNPPTIKEVLEKAGGLKEAAKADKNSLSEVLETGTLLNVQKESSQEIKIKMERMAANKLLVFSIPLDLNRASVEDLCLIPGIGESLAREIVNYREKRKGFGSMDELKKVKGFGEKKWKEFREFFVVRKSE
jgi:competence protein ComEA